MAKEKYAQMVAAFRFYEGYLELHLGSAKEREDVVNFRKLSSKVEADSDEVAEWLLFSLEQLKIFGMEIVNVSGINECMDFVREQRVN